MIIWNQEKMVEILSLLAEIWKSYDKKLDEQPDTTDMSELESKESTEKKKKAKKTMIKKTYTKSHA